MSDVNMDLIQGGHGAGDVAVRLMQSNFNVNALRPMTLLRKEEWLQYDQTLIEVARERLNGIADLRNAGLTYNLPNALGKTQLEWEKVSDMEGAQTSMAGVTEGQNDRIDFSMDSMPIPIVHKQFNLNIRALHASRTTGEPLDTTQAAYSARKVMEALESTLFLGTTVLGSNKPLYGYTTFPQRNTGSVTADWSTATGAQILADVIRMINVAHGDHMYGPFTLYVPLAAYVNMANDFKAESDKTIMQRLLEVPGISAIKSAEQLTGTNVVMVQMSRDVVDLVNGIQPTTIQWSSGDGMVQHFKIIAIMPPRFKSDYNGQCGIVHFS